MSASASKTPNSRNSCDIEIDSILDLLDEQDEAMQSLFAKALNLYVSPGADAAPEKEKLDRLEQAIEESLNQAGPPC